MTYSGALNGSLPALASVPAGYNCAFDTNTARQIRLSSLLPSPTKLTATASNLLIRLKWNPVIGANSYNLKRGTTNGGPTRRFQRPDRDELHRCKRHQCREILLRRHRRWRRRRKHEFTQTSAVPLPSNQPTNIFYR